MNSIMNNINPYIIHCGKTHKQTCPEPGTKYGLRQVKWFELELINWGEGHILTDDKKLEARKGTLFFRKPGMIVNGVSPYYCHLIIFDMIYNPTKSLIYHEQNPYDAKKSIGKNLLGDQMSTNTCFDFPQAIETTKYTQLLELFQNVYTTFLQKDTNWQFYLKTLLMQILVLSFQDWTTLGILNNSRRSLRLNYSRIMLVRKYIEDNCNSQLKLEDMAEISGLSPNFFCKVFHEIIGASPIDYTNKCRISKAKRLLVETYKLVKEISYECGFQNETYFYTLFKRIEGVSPISYRDLHHTLFNNTLIKN